MKKFIAFILLAAIQVSCAQDDKTIKTPEEIIYDVETVVDGISIPWGIAFLPNGDLLVTQKSGKLYLVHSGEKTEISHDLQVYNRGQGGLMDVRLHPNYQDNGWIYFSYA